MTDAELDALVARLRDNASQYIDHSDEWGEAADAITALMDSLGRARKAKRRRKNAPQETHNLLHAARAEVETLRELLKEASDEWIPHASVLSAAIVDALREAPDPAASKDHDWARGE